MFLGIDSENGRLVEGISTSNGRVLFSVPLVSLCKLTTDRNDLSEGLDPAYATDKIYFREDFYDPRSRLRRGRVYKANNQSHMSWMITGEGYTKSHIETYSNHSVWAYCQQNNQRNIYVLLGDKSRFTRWKVVDIEVIHTGEELITLKALTAFGLLPEVLDNEVPLESLSRIKNKLQQIVDDMYASSAESTVDNCREAASAIIGSFVNQPDKDLGNLITILASSAYEKRMAASAAAVINLFHPRRKASEQVKLGLRTISDEDAQLAV